LIFSLVITALFFYFGVFAPLKTEIEKTAEENFNNIVSIAEINSENYLQNIMLDAESISSRSMIKEKLVEYDRGLISKEELRNYTRPKFIDGVKVLKNVISALRVDNSQAVIAAYQKTDSHFLEIYDNYQTNNTDIRIYKDKKIILVNSPILIDGNEKVGNDILIFKFDPLLKNIESENINYSLIEYSDFRESFSNAENINLKDIKNLDSVISDNYERDLENLIIDYRKLINTDYLLKASMTEKSLHESVEELSLKIIFGFSVLIVLLALIWNKTLNDSSKKIIKALEKDLKKTTKAAETDEMLQIYNRSKFIDILKSEMEEGRFSRRKLSLIMFDVDKFKNINDKFGHHVGDVVLRGITEIVKNEIRAVDTFARYGGEEFMIIVPDIDIKNAVKIAKRLRKAIAEKEFEDIENVSCSFGVSQMKKEDDIDSFIQRADKALYKAKERGRNRVCFLQ